MKQAIKILLLAIMIPATAHAGLLDFFKSGTSDALQHDLDIARLKDLAMLSGYVEEYKKLTGKYPYEGDVKIPHYVHIATRNQQKYAKGGPPYKHKKTSAEAFIKELQSKLGTDIEIPFDLQKVPTNKPNFYIYMVIDSIYYLAVHVHNEYTFANKVADYYNKVEITNSPKAVRKGVWLRDELLSNKEYIAATNATPNKPGYTEKLRVKMGGNSAF